MAQIGCTPCGVSVGPRFGRPKCEFGARSGADCPACTNGGDLRGKVSENCVIRRAKWGSAARWLRSAVLLFVWPSCRTLSRFGRPKCEFGARSGANCPACTNSGDLPGKVSENCAIRRAKWGSAATWLRSAVHLVECRWGRDLGAQNANLGPGLAQIAQPVRMAEICVGKCLKTVLFGAPNGGRLPDGSDRLYALWSVGGAAI